MSDDEKKTQEQSQSRQDNKTTVSDDEIANIENELSQTDSQREKEIREKARKEYEMENQLKKLEEEKKGFEENYKKQQEELDRLKEERQREIDDIVNKRIEDELAQRKSVASAENPFEKKEKEQKFNPRDLSESDLKSIQEESRRAFEKAFATK